MISSVKTKKKKIKIAIAVCRIPKDYKAAKAVSIFIARNVKNKITNLGNYKWANSVCPRVYAPTDDAQMQIIDDFYKELEEVLKIDE